jgi:rRNA-processing protein FCF1
MSVALFPDTNIYLHFQPIEDVDWLGVTGYSSVEIVIPRIVTRELNEKKDAHPSARTRDRARSVLKRIEEWLSEGTKQLRPHVGVVSYAKVPEIDFSSLGLNPAWNDDFLLATILTYQSEYSGQEAVLVTDDAGLRIRARELRIEAVALPDDLRLKEDPDEAEAEVRRLRRELVKIEAAQPRLDVRFLSGDGFVKFQIPAPPEDLDERINERIGELQAKYPEHRGSSASSLVLPDEIARYSKERERYLADYARYLTILAVADAECTVFKIELVVRNDGGVPADEIDVHLDLPDGFAVHDYWEEEIPEEPIPPRPPRPPMQVLAEQMKQITSLGRGVGTFTIPNLTLPGVGSVLRNASGPRIREVESYEVEYSIRRLKHGYSELLDPLFIVFEESEAVKSFQIEYVVSAANLRSPSGGKLHVVFEQL